MEKISKLLVSVSFLGIAFSISAEVWSLDSCVAYAIEHNINIRQHNLRVKEGELAITEAKDRFLPSADASAGQSFNFGRGLTAENTYANRNTSNTQWGISVSLPLFQGMTEYHRLEIAKLSLQQYVFERESTKDNLTLNVISQYLQVLYNKEVAKSAQSQSELSAFEVERQKALIEAGKVAEATLYDLQSVAAQDHLQVVTAENDVQTSLVSLANLLHLTTVEGFDIASLEDVEPLIPTPDVVYASAMGINNGILGLRQAVKVADRNISLAKSGYMPTISFNGGIGSSYYTVSGLHSESFGAQMRHNFSTYIGLSLRVPLFDAFNTRNGVNRAKLQKLNAELSLDQQSSDLYKEIQLAYFQAIGARERYKTSEETLKNTQLSFDSTRERFNLGRATQADYEQAKNNLFKTELAQIQAHYEYILRTYILEFYRTNGRENK